MTVNYITVTVKLADGSIKAISAKARKATAYIVINGSSIIISNRLRQHA